MLTIRCLGRSWSIQELREKSWEDLHALWWVCVKERNRIATSQLERQRLKAGYGEWELDNRDRTVSSFPTQKASGYYMPLYIGNAVLDIDLAC